MNIAVVYIYPLNGAGHFGERAMKFMDSYHRNPPGRSHDTIIMCNGGPANEETYFTFASLPNVKLIEHDDNAGQDIGAYQMAAEHHPCDLMVFCGGNSYFRGPGWLQRIEQSFLRHGDTLYGCTGNRGDSRFNVYPHIRTTGFWISPNLMNAYPMRVTNNSQRYPFEHGPKCLTMWIKKLNKIPYVVSWDGEYEQRNWDHIPNGFRKGDQSNIIIGDRLTEPPYHRCP